MVCPLYALLDPRDLQLLHFIRLIYTSPGHRWCRETSIRIGGYINYSTVENARNAAIGWVPLPINQSIDTLIQVDKPQRDSKIIRLTKTRLKYDVQRPAINTRTMNVNSVNVFRNHSGYKISVCDRWAFCGSEVLYCDWYMHVLRGMLSRTASSRSGQDPIPFTHRKIIITLNIRNCLICSCCKAYCPNAWQDCGSAG